MHDEHSGNRGDDLGVIVAMFTILGAAIGGVLGYGLGHHHSDTLAIAAMIGAFAGFFFGAMVMMLD